MTEYFIIEQETMQEGPPVLDTLPEDIDVLDFTSGRRVERSSDPIVIALRESIGSFLPDMLTYLIPLFSEKLKHILNELHVSNIDYYPVELIDTDTRKIDRTYWLANIIGCIECVDIENSDATYDKLFKKHTFKSFLIDESKVRDASMFRLAEKQRLIIIDEALKASLDRAELQGVRVRNTRDYDGY